MTDRSQRSSDPLPETLLRSVDEAQAIRDLRAGAAIGFVLLVASVAASLNYPASAFWAAPLDAALIIVLAAVFSALSFAPGFARYRKPATLGFGVFLILLFVRVSAIAGDADPRFVAVILCPVATALFASWDAGWQAAMTLLSLLSLAAAELLLPLNDPHGRDRWGWLVVTVVFAQAVVSARERYKKNLRGRLKALEEAAEQRERETATIAHDIRSPLGAISGFLTLLQDGELGNEERSALLWRTGSIVRRLELLVENIVDLDRLEKGPPELNRRSVDPDSVAAELARSYAEEAKSKNTSLIADLRCRSSANLDRNHLERILSNFLAYAVARTAGGEIRLKTNARDDRLTIEVSDSGPQIAPPEIGRLFDRPDSYQTRSGASKLGLYIARLLVEACGGKIEAASPAGAGLSLTAEIPLELELHKAGP